MSGGRIHATAIVDPGAEIDPTAEIGPYCVIEAGVSVGPRTRIGPYVHIQGRTRIGADNAIGTGTTIGHAPQHLDYKGAPTRVEIGDGNTIRESVSIHRALREGDATVIGSGCYLMGFSHVAHDCRVEDGVILANGSLLAGHVTVGRRTFISGLVGVHQFVRIGRLAMLAGGSAVTQDVPPFMIVKGDPALLRSLNAVGLQRAALSGESRAELKRLYRSLYRSGRGVREAIAGLDREALTPEGRELIDFYGESKRGVTAFERYRSRGRPDAAE